MHRYLIGELGRLPLVLEGDPWTARVHGVQESSLATPPMLRIPRIHPHYNIQHLHIRTPWAGRALQRMVQKVTVFPLCEQGYRMTT